MTTIAYRNGVMASDTQNNYDGMKITGVRKLFQGQNSLVGFAGNPQFVTPFVRWWRKHESIANLDPREWVENERPALENEMLAMMYHDKFGLFFVHHDGYVEEQPHEFFAIGSGACFAFAAMDQGSSAPEAVGVAMKYDLHSGGDIEAISL